MNAEPAKGREYRKRAVRNMLFPGLQIPLKLVVGFLLPPFILAWIGAERYGVWVLVMATGSYIAMLDAGVSAALVKYVAEYHAAGRFNDLNRMVWTVFVLFLGAGATFLAVFVGLSNGIVRLLFDITTTDAATVKALLAVVGGIYVLSLLGTVFYSVLIGIQRLDASTLIDMARLVVNVLTTLALLGMGWGLWALAAGWGMGVVIWAVWAGAWARRLVPSLGIPRAGIQMREYLARLFGLSASGLMVRLSGMAVSQIDKFLLAYFAGLRWVTFYDLAFGFVTQIRSLPGVVFAPFVPMASDLAARHDRASIETLFARGLRYLNACGLPLYAFAVVFAPAIVTVWLGEGYAPVAWAIQLMAVGNYVSLLNGPPYMISVGLGQPRLGVRFSIVLTGLTIVLSPVLIPVFGYAGAVWSYVAAASIAAVYLLWNFHRENQIPAGVIYVTTVVVPVLLMAALALGVRSLFEFFNGLGRWGTGVLLGEAAVLFFLLSAVLMWWIRLFGREDWELVWDAVGISRLVSPTRR